MAWTKVGSRAVIDLCALISECLGHQIDALFDFLGDGCVLIIGPNSDTKETEVDINPEVQYEDLSRCELQPESKYETLNVAS